MAQLAREAGGTVVPFASLTASSSSASSTNPAVTQIVVNDLPISIDCGHCAQRMVLASHTEWCFQFAASLYALKQQCLESSASAAAAATAGLSSSASASSATGAAAARKRRRLAPQQPLESLAGPPDPSDLMLLSLAQSSCRGDIIGAAPSVRCEQRSQFAGRHSRQFRSLNDIMPVRVQCGIDSVSSRLDNRSKINRQQQQPVDSRQQRRLQKAMELAHTEANYVSILGVIVNVIRREVADASRPGGALLPDMAISKQRKNGASSSAAASASAAAGGSHTGKPSSSALKPTKAAIPSPGAAPSQPSSPSLQPNDDRDAQRHPSIIRFPSAPQRARPSLSTRIFARVDVDELRVETNGVFDRQHQLSAKARRFGKRVTRALSNRTPRRTLTRAVSAALCSSSTQCR
uniref:DH domain-containing protein n=1 Tax=Macrostomum lignano TaxID=282301 RepID=A0A1I8JMK8_9PLAT